MRELITLVFVAVSLGLQAQNVGIGTKEPLSKLHVAGDIRIDSLAGRDSGLVVYDNNGKLTTLKFSGEKQHVLSGDGKFYPLNIVADISNSWLTTGNAGTIAGQNFIGTIDAQPLIFKANGRDMGKLDGKLLNVAFGYDALLGNGSGKRNIAIGTLAMYTNQTGWYNIAIGHEALYSNTAVGQTEGLGWANIAIGWQAMKGNITGTSNTAVGNFALNTNTAGRYNTAIGENTLTMNKEGGYNTAIGQGALWVNENGNRNTAVGFGSLLVSQTSDQTAIGYKSLSSNTTGTNNTATGYLSLYSNSRGSSNTAAGSYALFNNSIGTSNVASGYQTLLNNTSGVSNTAAGTRALNKNTDGVNNSALGYGALASNTRGSLNTAVGMFADVTSPNLVNTTALGYNAKVNASNKVRIGNSAVTKIEGQVPFSIPSDGRYKFNVKEDVKGLDFVMRLRPVSYQFDVSKFDVQDGNVIQASYHEALAKRRTGFIAQEVEIAASLAHFDFNGIDKPKDVEDHYSLSYEAFVMPLVKAVQEQQAMIDNIHKELLTHKEVNKQLMRSLELMQKEIDTIKSRQDR